MTEDLITRLRKRAEIRRQISTRKSVQEGKPDRIADLLEEAANTIEKYEKELENKKPLATQFFELLRDLDDLESNFSKRTIKLEIEPLSGSNNNKNK
jgi:hypothetical protein